MRVLVIRHGQAVPQGAGSFTDAERPLTPDGERSVRASAAALGRVAPKPDILLTSPLVRARQTAALIAGAWPGVEPVSEAALASGSVAAILKVLERHPRGAFLALVGHEPTVSALLCELLGIISSEAISFDPGAAALLELASLERHSGRLLWFLPPMLVQRV
jgi:phosphohistidine phosphatase